MPIHFRRLLMLGIILLSTGCGDDYPPLEPLLDDDTILAFGDSLTYGTGAGQSHSYPARLENLTGIEVINAGVPGEISSEGLSRLPRLLTEHQPDLVILCHGGNDLLRKRNKTRLGQNLREMIELIQQSGAEVVMIAVPQPTLTMRVPAIYEQLADKYDVPLNQSVIRDILQDNQLKSDPIHPNKQGYRLMATAIHELLLETGALTP